MNVFKRIRTRKAKAKNIDTQKNECHLSEALNKTLATRLLKYIYDNDLVEYILENIEKRVSVSDHKSVGVNCGNDGNSLCNPEELKSSVTMYSQDTLFYKVEYYCGDILLYTKNEKQNYINYDEWLEDTCAKEIIENAKKLKREDLEDLVNMNYIGIRTLASIMGLEPSDLVQMIKEDSKSEPKLILR